jgi:predicted DCC family thiol-disulfide oxidoreductase YuxK
MQPNHAIVLFDGICHLCTTSVQFIITRDPNGYFTFASLQSEVGRTLLEKHGCKWLRVLPIGLTVCKV